MTTMCLFIKVSDLTLCVEAYYIQKQIGERKICKLLNENEVLNNSFRGNVCSVEGESEREELHLISSLLQNLLCTE